MIEYLSTHMAIKWNIVGRTIRELTTEPMSLHSNYIAALFYPSCNDGADIETYERAMPESRVPFIMFA